MKISVGKRPFGSHYSSQNMILPLVLLMLTIQCTKTQGPILEVKAVAKGTAHLPCNVRPPLPNDSVLLVVWYKNDVDPIYSLDTRGKVSDMGFHWRDADVLERSFFRTITEPATLSIDNVQEWDGALYRCRVDFKISPTRNNKVKLTVIVPPMKPEIFDDKGNELNSIAGPYMEDSEMKLSCIVSGGRPEPQVKWWRDSSLIDSSDSNTELPNIKNNRLVVRKLDRSHFNSVYTCEASNNNISQPVSTKVTVEMILKPLGVSILSSRQALSVGHDYEIVCQSWGSRPAAKIAWLKDSQLLRDSVEEITKDGNVTTSTLRFTPSVKDNGAQLVCRSVNFKLNDASIDDIWVLNVFYKPIVRIGLGTELNPNDIEEGDDVYFECKIDANPSAYKVTWRHNNAVIHLNLKAGIVLSHKALALQSIKKSQAGNYSCMASNVEGDGESDAVQLNIMYTPICKIEQKHIFGVARNEVARVMCEVDSYPPPNEFEWKFNNSADTITISPSRYQNSLNESLSTLSYVPLMEVDYGTVMCWASNAAGKQRDPCIFHIIPAGRPDVPYNCTVSKRTTSSLDVECFEGFDGGQPQLFQIEAYDLNTNLLVVNKTGRRSSFQLFGLPPGSSLRMFLYAFNSKGKSDSINVEGFTLKIPAKQTGAEAFFDVTPVILVLVAISILVTCIIVSFSVMKVRKTAAGGAPITSLGYNEKKTVHGKPYYLYDAEDNNPDIIPNTRDIDYQLMSHPSKTKPDSASHTPSTECALTLPSRSIHEVLNDGSDVCQRNGNVQKRYSSDEKKNLNGRPYDDANEMTSSHPREVISVKTPLMMRSQQESCV